MTKKSINEEIARLLGFRKTKNGWIYPNNFQYMRSGSPERHCPDFLCMIDRYRQIREMLNYSYPRVYGFVPDEEYDNSQLIESK